MALTPAQTTRITVITNRYTTLNKTLTSLETYVAIDADPVNAKLRLDTLKEKHQEFSRCVDELTDMDPEHEIITSFDTWTARYYEVAATVTKMYNKSLSQTTSAPFTNSTLNTSNITLTERSDKPRLPQIQLPTFDGNRAGWATFKNQFLTLVHNRDDLGDDIKASQLFCHLKDSALAKVGEYDPCAADYENAWKALLESYDQKRIVVNRHINALLDLKRVGNKPGEQSLSLLLDTVRQHLNILKRVDVKPSDEVMVRIIERCLPPAVYSKWNDKLEMDRLPTVDELLKFLQNCVFKLEALEESNDHGHNPRKRPANSNQQNTSKTLKITAQSLVTSAESSSSSNPATAGITPATRSCPKCKGEHRLFTCEAFQALDVQERWKFAKANRLCFNCLWNHPFPCNSEKHCKECGKNHHSLLHNVKTAQAAKGQGSKHKSEARSSTTEPKT